MAGYICSFSIIYVLLNVSFVRADQVAIASTTSITSNCTAEANGNGSSSCKTISYITAQNRSEAPPQNLTIPPSASPRPPNQYLTILPKIPGAPPQNLTAVPNLAPREPLQNLTVLPNMAPQNPSPNHTDIAPSPLRAPNKPESPTPPKRHRKNLAPVVAGSTAGGLIIISLLIGLFLVVLWRTKVGEDYVKQVPGMPVSFSYAELRNATENFKERLGGGGFGSVFKGVLADGTSIAVKRLEKVSQGMKEFIAEVDTIGSVHHFNLVRLIGSCAEKSFRLLVYEYMSNGSLDNWIFYRDQRLCLDWQTRKKIILDIAKGLAYLHEECRQRIVHLDIKPQNILLDENFNAKISDFGLSKLIGRDESQVQTTMRGTVGYIAPEWRQLRITLKVDIYSFGIVLLEMVCARRNLDRSRSESSMHLLSVLQQKAEEDGLIDLVDNFDEDMQSHREEVERMIRIAAWCLQDDHTKRPLMSTVVKALEGVMEVDPNINYKFAYAMASSPVVNDNISSTARPGYVLSAVNDYVSSPAQPGSVLSAPR